MRTASFSEHFHKIDVFLKSCEKTLMLALFLEVETTKNREKMVLRNMFFLSLNFIRFFSGFDGFGLILGGPEGSKKLKKKNRKNRVRDGFGTRLGSSIDFGHDFGAIFADFGRTLIGFWKDFGRIMGRFLERFHLTNND